MSDLLDMDKINSLPLDLIGTFTGQSTWPIYDIDVETGLLRIDVCGKLQIMHFGELMLITDGNGQEHNPDDFYIEEQEYISND